MEQPDQQPLWHPEPLLHVHAPFFFHDEAYLVGSTEGLLRLRAAIDEALQADTAIVADLMTSDGEGFNLVVRHDPSSCDDWHHELPYINREECGMPEEHDPATAPWADPKNIQAVRDRHEERIAE